MNEGLANQNGCNEVGLDQLWWRNGRDSVHDVHIYLGGDGGGDPVYYNVPCSWIIPSDNSEC